MMKTLKVIIVLFISTLLFTSCDDNESKNSLDFSLIKTSLKNTGESEEIIEENAPFITTKDSDCYLWDGSVLKINTNKLQEKIGEKLYQGFILEVKGKSIYNGVFLSLLSSYMPDKSVKVFTIDMPDQEQYIEIYRITQ